MNLRLHVLLESYGKKAVGPTTIVDPHVHMYKDLTMAFLWASVSTYDRGQSTLTDFAIAAVPGRLWRIGPEWHVDDDDFAFAIPLDCVTSTPVVARKRSGTPAYVSS